MRAKFLFLGTGASSGVPVLGCKCSVCLSKDKKNKRLRSSALIQISKKIFLLDVSPDFREQGLKNKIYHIDGLLLTHAHYDHIGGLDDLRSFNFIEDKPIPCLLSRETFEELKKGYHYIFKPQTETDTLSTRLKFSILEKDFGDDFFETIKISYFSFLQKTTRVLGYRIGDLAYVSDIRTYNEDIFSHLKGLSILIVSALRDLPSPSHFSVEEAIDFAKKVGAKKTYFTHLSHEIDHKKVEQSLNKNIFLAYDGLKLEFNYGSN